MNKAVFRRKHCRWDSVTVGMLTPVVMAAAAGDGCGGPEGRPL